MKRTLILLVILFIFYLVIQMIFNYVGPGHDIEYSVDGYSVHEVLTQHKKEDADNYYFEIKKDDIIFNFQIDNVRQGSKLVKDIEYFKNVNYECMIPILRIKGDYLNVVCKKDNVYYNYSDIKGKDPEVDDFAIKYDKTYENSSKSLKNNANLFVYNNLLEDHYMVLEYYKGIYIINTKDTYKRISLFKKETYAKPLATIVDNYYVVADYNEKYDFHKFNVIDLKTNGKSTIVSNNAISFNSYIEGVVDGEIYLFDKDNQKQYRINVDNETVIEIGNEKKGVQIYQNGEFKNMNVYEVTDKEVLFTNNTENTIDGKKYAKVDLVGSKTAGYYYIYDLNDNEYTVYRASVRNPKIKTYLFKTTSIDHVAYAGTYVYYLNDGKVYAYSNLGNRLILSYKDIKYNNDLKFFVYAG